MSSDAYYLTTAIDYASGPPHLGHAYEKIAADVFARHYRQRGRDVRLLVGTDEHGTKIQKAAAKAGIEPQAFVDSVARQYVALWELLQVRYDDFIRTTEARHRDAVAVLFERLREGGAIYKASYEGLYCAGCEAFVLERDLQGGLCVLHQRAPDRVTEENYFFRFSLYKDRIREHIASTPTFLQPETRRNEILNLLADFEDFSVSRAREAVSWGIPVPGDPGQVIYVWLDALSNYITAVGYPHDLAAFERWWPAQVHHVGKDITKFHAIIWPAMLLALGLPLPQTVFGHGFVTAASGLKMSKTLGNVVDPREVAEKYTADALRYYLTREIPFGRDGEFSLEAFEQRIDSDLANNLGNALNRLLPLVEKQFEGRVPAPPAGGLGAGALPARAQAAAQAVAERFDAFDPQGALVATWALSDAINKHVEATAPWALAKRPEAREELAGALYACLESLRIVGVLASPVIPTLSARIWEQLGLPADPAAARWPDLAWGGLPAGAPVQRRGPLYPRVGTAIAGSEKKAGKER